jgi:amino acid adenylation domain-containing protein
LLKSDRLPIIRLNQYAFFRQDGYVTRYIKQRKDVFMTTSTDESDILERQDIYAFPASFAQERLWLLDQLEPNTATYNLSYTLHISGSLDVQALERSLNALIERHEILRTRFIARDGKPMQVVDASLSLPLVVLDLQEVPESQREAEVLRLANEQVQQPFDLVRGPLLRAILLRLNERESLFVLVVHHIIFDSWSMGVFFRELQTIYQGFIGGQVATLPDLVVQYADFAHWQREWLQGELLQEQLSYWKGHLANATSVLELPYDYARPSVLRSQGSSRLFKLPGFLSDSLKALSRREGVGLFMTLVAAFQTLLYRYSGQEDVLIGTVTADRAQPEIENVIGFFVNTLVLRSDLSADPTFRELLARVREVILQAQAHQNVPFEHLVKELKSERSLGQNPFFQVMMALEPPSPALLPGWTVKRMDLKTGGAKFDLYLEMEDQPDGLLIYLEYNSDLFEEATIVRMVGHWQTLLEGIVAHPEKRLSELPFLPEHERHQLLVEWNATAQAYPADQCIHQLFEEQVKRSAGATALVYEEQASTYLTYRELNERANRLAHHLRQLGVGPDVLVGLCMDRSLEMVVGMLGILKAGGAYVPLDPAFPSERIAFMLEDAQAPVLVTQRHLLAQFPRHGTQIVCLDADEAGLAGQPTSNLVTASASDNLAYVIYTSGSTGRPKGVQIPHRAVVNFLLSMRQQPGLTADDRWLAVTTLSFDIAALELFLPLLVGACVIVASRDVVTSGRALAETISCSRATVMQATPVTWRMLLAAGWQGERQLKVLCGGEALPLELAQQLLPKVASLWNMYGPTETTIWSTVSKIEPDDKMVTIGHPIANTQVYILDAHLQLRPIGVPGELYIGGDGLARGYLNRPELTAERFIRHPFSNEPGARLYKTGDLARYRTDGHIEHLGRLDFQVKIRGFRIELGEIESVLSHHPAVQQVVVMAREDAPGDKQLVAYVVLHEKQTATAGELQQHTMKQLPNYMLPAAFVFLEAFPLTPNNKVDRGKLPAPDQLQSDKPYVAPRTPVEETVAKAWSQALGVERVGVQDNFFALGGHSLLAMQIISGLRMSLQVELPLRGFFEAPTVAQLSEIIEQLKANSSKSRVPVIRALSREAQRVQLVEE